MLYLDYRGYKMTNQSIIYADTPRYKKAWIERKYNKWYNYCIEHNIDPLEVTTHFVYNV